MAIRTLKQNPTYLYLRVVFVEDSGAGVWIESEQALAAQQIHALSGCRKLRIQHHVSVVAQELDRVAQGDGVLKVPLGLTLSHGIHLKNTRCVIAMAIVLQE